MDKETGMILLAYFGLAFPALVGGIWMSSWLYVKKEDTRHWRYVVALLALMGLQALFFRGGPFEVAFSAVILAIPGAVLGCVLGGVFGQFFPENRGGIGNIPDPRDPELQ